MARLHDHPCDPHLGKHKILDLALSTNNTMVKDDEAVEVDEGIDDDDDVVCCSGGDDDDDDDDDDKQDNAMIDMCICCQRGKEAAFSHDQLRVEGIYLHALHYSTPKWSFNTSLPCWTSGFGVE
jgi:hypothetical protein